MLTKLFSHARHNTVAYIALFIAMSGTAVAASAITGKQVVDDSLTGADIAEATLGKVALADNLDGKVDTAVVTASGEIEQFPQNPYVSVRCPDDGLALRGAADPSPVDQYYERSTFHARFAYFEPAQYTLRVLCLVGSTPAAP